MRTNFEEKRANRLERYNRLAEKYKNESDERWKRFSQMCEITNGQPILIGHHSEKAHRRLLDKIHNTGRIANELGEKSAYYERKAEIVENGTAISSDDSTAIEKLTEKIKRLESSHQLMKDCNKIIKGKSTDAEKVTSMVALGLTQRQAIELLVPNCFGRIGFPPYTFQNNSANIRTAKQRLAHLQQMEAATNEEKIFGDIEILHNASENRVQIFFPSIPAEQIRKKLKLAGFRWSPTVGAWQAFYSNMAKYRAEEIVKQIQSMPVSL